MNSLLFSEGFNSRKLQMKNTLFLLKENAFPTFVRKAFSISWIGVTISPNILGQGLEMIAF